MIKEDLLRKIIAKIGSKFNKKIILKNVSSLSGGCINACYRIETSKGIFFLKSNTNSSSKMFLLEAKGLEILKQTGCIRTPEIILINEDFLLLEFISSAGFNSWENFGRDLASLHKNTNDFFGLNHSNFIGSLNQQNDPEKSWCSFFIHQRLLPQLKLGNFSSSFLSAFDVLFEKIPSLFPKHSPELVHGDLWSGNFIMTKDSACLIDPAVYYGNREMDIAMTTLFGGFHASFYEAYNESFPLLSGWRDRIDLCNLYPLLVHVNLFGGSYYDQALAIVNRYR